MMRSVRIATSGTDGRRTSSNQPPQGSSSPNAKKRDCPAEGGTNGIRRVARQRSSNLHSFGARSLSGVLLRCAQRQQVSALERLRLNVLCSKTSSKPASASTLKASDALLLRETARQLKHQLRLCQAAVQVSNEVAACTLRDDPAGVFRCLRRAEEEQREEENRRREAQEEGEAEARKMLERRTHPSPTTAEAETIGEQNSAREQIGDEAPGVETLARQSSEGVATDDLTLPGHREQESFGLPLNETPIAIDEHAMANEDGMTISLASPLPEQVVFSGTDSTQAEAFVHTAAEVAAPLPAPGPDSDLEANSRPPRSGVERPEGQSREGLADMGAGSSLANKAGEDSPLATQVEHTFAAAGQDDAPAQLAATEGSWPLTDFSPADLGAGVGLSPSTKVEELAALAIANCKKEGVDTAHHSGGSSSSSSSSSVSCPQPGPSHHAAAGACQMSPAAPKVPPLATGDVANALRACTPTGPFEVGGALSSRLAKLQRFPPGSTSGSVTLSPSLVPPATTVVVARGMNRTQRPTHQFSSNPLSPRQVPVAMPSSMSAEITSESRCAPRGGVDRDRSQSYHSFTSHGQSHGHSSHGHHGHHAAQQQHHHHRGRVGGEVGGAGGGEGSTRSTTTAVHSPVATKTAVPYFSASAFASTTGSATIAGGGRSSFPLSGSTSSSVTTAASAGNKGLSTPLSSNRTHLPVRGAIQSAGLAEKEKDKVSARTRPSSAALLRPAAVAGGGVGVGPSSRSQVAPSQSPSRRSFGTSLQLSPPSHAEVHRQPTCPPSFSDPSQDAASYPGSSPCPGISRGSFSCNIRPGAATAATTATSAVSATAAARAATVAASPLAPMTANTTAAVATVAATMPAAAVSAVASGPAGTTAKVYGIGSVAAQDFARKGELYTPRVREKPGRPVAHEVVGGCIRLTGGSMTDRQSPFQGCHGATRPSIPVGSSWQSPTSQTVFAVPVNKATSVQGRPQMVGFSNQTQVLPRNSLSLSPRCSQDGHQQQHGLPERRM